MLPGDEVSQVPAPFHYLPRPGQYANEAKRFEPIQREPGEGHRRGVLRIGGDHGRNYMPSTHRFAGHSLWHGVTVNQRETPTQVIQGDPGSTTRFRGANDHAAIPWTFRGGQSRPTRPVLVPIHREVIARRPWYESDCAHVFSSRRREEAVLCQTGRASASLRRRLQRSHISNTLRNPHPAASLNSAINLPQDSSRPPWRIHATSSKGAKAAWVLRLAGDLRRQWKKPGPTAGRAFDRP